MLHQRARQYADQPLSTLLDGCLRRPLALALLRAAGLDHQSLGQSLSSDGLQRLALAIGDFRLTVRGAPPSQQAQVMRGGLPVAAFFPETLAARRCPGLFAAGECLDVDGPCGGYNLHWAWASGWLAGGAAAKLAGVAAAKNGIQPSTPGKRID
ncbi:MAG: NAD(P)/FAD-dependent oxidoreductase [Actinomycetia bacterium]|nr:NAD(P)/FAD-dependent oxidoreductase [Actinomycetes bacterium]